MWRYYTLSRMYTLGLLVSVVLCICPSVYTSFYAKNVIVIEMCLHSMRESTGQHHRWVFTNKKKHCKARVPEAVFWCACVLLESLNVLCNLPSHLQSNLHYTMCSNHFNIF